MTMFDSMLDALTPRLEGLLKDTMPGLEAKLAEYVGELRRLNERVGALDEKLDAVLDRLTDLELDNLER